MLLYHSEKTHAPLEPIPQEHGKICIAQNTKIHKILLSCNLVIHVKARVLKAKASNPRPGSRLSPDFDKAKTKTNTSNPRSRPRPDTGQVQDQGLTSLAFCYRLSQRVKETSVNITKTDSSVGVH